MAAPPPVLTLAVEKGARQGLTRQCRAGATLRVGRVFSGNDLAVRDVGASQHHLFIEYLPPPAARWAVSDLGSSNGTFLNGARLAPSVPAPLSHGDRILLGESTALAVSIAPDSEVKPAPRRSSRRAVPVDEDKPTPSVIRRSTRKKAGEAPDPEADKEEPDAAVTGRNKAAAAKSLEAGKEAKAPVATRRTRSNKDALIVTPPLPPKARSTRARGRACNCAKKAALEEEVPAVREEGDKVADGDGEVEGTAEAENVEKVEKHAGRSSLETMTLGEWFDRMEKYLPRTINEAADEMIASMEETQRRIHEYISTLE